MYKIKFLSKVLAHEIRGTNFWDIMYKWSLDTITQSFCEKKIYI